MNPAKIVIEGDFWDCQIYRGRLYLWETNGGLRVINWYELVQSFITEPAEELALTCAFLEGRFLYASNLRVLFEDYDFKDLLTQKFNQLLQRELIITYKELEEFTMSVQDNPFGELQTDSEIVNNTIYALTYDGLITAGAHKPAQNKNMVTKKTNKLNDFVGYTVKAGKYGRLALSGGEEGLYEYDASKADYEGWPVARQTERFKQITNKHSSFADFNYLSLYNSSLLGKSFLSLYKLGDNTDFKMAYRHKQLEDEVSESKIFGSNGVGSLSWGTGEKLYKANNNTLEVVRFNNYAKVERDYFSEKESFVFQAWKGRILKGGTAYFGTIIECENAVVALTGEGEFYNIPGAATRWRVYPRSFNYENHLHVIHENKLEVYSFNHDYFRDQMDKDFGIMFTENFKADRSGFRRFR